MSKIGEFDSIAVDVPTASLQALELGKEVRDILLSTNEGFEEQSKLLKKIAIRMFKKNAKMPIEEWIQYAEDLIPEIECLVKVINGGNKKEISQSMSLISEAKPKLMDLKEYYNKTAQLVKRFFKGDELKENLEGITGSEQKVGLFIQVIEFLDKNN